MDHFTVKKRENGAYKLKCYRKVLKIPWTRKVKSIDILWDINTRENWLLTRNVDAVAMSSVTVVGKEQ